MQDILVSVIVPAFNCEHSVGDAVASIVNQDYRNLEIIIINDGSTDRTGEIIHAISDPRIVFLDNPQNLGLIETLNKGLRRATGKYIARMDADDLAFPSRISEQVAYMESHPSIGLLGTNMIQFGESTAKVRFRSDPSLLKGLLLFQNEFAHPTVMMRREVMVQHNLWYESDFLHVEDYALWVQFSRVSLVTNLQKYLLKYNVSKSSISQIANRNVLERDQKHILIHGHALAAIGMKPSMDELRLHRAISAYSPYRFGDKAAFFKAKEWLIKISDALVSANYIPRESLQQVMSYQWYVLCSKSSQLGLFSLLQFYFQQEFSVSRMGLSRQLRLIIKCLVQYQRKNAKDFTD